MIRLKICGMQSAQDITLCAAQRVDALGFIFAPGPRQLTIDEAERLTALVPASIKCVGVFADSPRALIAEALKRCRLDLLQFAGNEPAELCGSFGLPTLLTVRLYAPPPDVVHRARAVAVIADARVNGAYGGTGVRIEPERARRIRNGCPVPFILAGGLTPENVGEAIRELQPHGVDVRSGVERDGRKDPRLVAQFARAVEEAYGARA